MNSEGKSDSGPEKPDENKEDQKAKASSENQEDQEKKAGGAKEEGGGRKTEGKNGDDNKKGSPKTPVYKRPGYIITAAVILVMLLIGGIIIWLIARQYISTDDAYIDGHVTQVSPRAAAQVLVLHVSDNQLVHAGDLLVELDPTDYNVALDQAKAQLISAKARLSQAQAQTETAKATVAEAGAGVEAARVQQDNAAKDLKRYQDVDVRARSAQQLDNARTAQKNAEAQLKQAEAKKISSDASVTSAVASVSAAEGEVKTAEANLRRAEVNLSYCRIVAPTDGRVTQRTVEVGNYVVVGQAMFMLTDLKVWVTANFKETQLTDMRPGQPVTIKVDAFPGTRFRGHVDSIQAGSGSRFSILPAENATGNFVKVVQRVPVKIYFDEAVNTNDAVLFSPGLSVVPRVKVR